jgi:hypothetical protein
MSCRTLSLVPGFEFHMKATVYPIDAAAPNRVAIVARPRSDWLRDELSALSRKGLMFSSPC